MLQRKEETMQEPQSFTFTSSSFTSSATSPTRSKFIHRRRGRGKMVQLVRTNYKASVDLENVVESKQQTIQKDNINVSLQTVFLVPSPVWGITKEKLEENSDASSNSPLPLIPISRILKGIPQSPHFFQLRHYSELAREKLVVAWDEAFEDTTEQVHDLKLDKNFWVSVKMLWKTTGDLQCMGYNVTPIRRRLVEMTEVMNKFEKSKLEILTLKNKVEDHRMEKNRLESMVMSLQRRAEMEEMNMVQVLAEAYQIEKALPKFDVLIAYLAMKPFDADA